MKTVEVQICLGTTCFVMGAGYLQELTDSLPKTFGEQVKVSCIRCMGMCEKSEKFSQAPYVTVDGEVISSATKEKVFEAVEKKLNHD